MHVCHKRGHVSKDCYSRMETVLLNRGYAVFRPPSPNQQRIQRLLPEAMHLLQLSNEAWAQANQNFPQISVQNYPQNFPQFSQPQNTVQNIPQQAQPQNLVQNESQNLPQNSGQNLLPAQNQNPSPIRDPVVHDRTTQAS